MDEAGSGGGARPARPPGVVRLGAVAGIPVYVRPSWFVVAGLIAVLVAPRIDLVAPDLGDLVYVAGALFAILLYLSVLLHEVSHAVAAKTFGMQVHSIELHFLGGVTAIEEASSARREAVIAAVGPLTSLAVAAVAWFAAPLTPDGLTRFILQALAGANLVIGVLNLLPGLPLDGGRVLRAAVWGITGRPLTGSLAAGWTGRVIAVLVLAYPLLLARLSGVGLQLVDVAFAAILAAFLWSGATQSLVSARLRARLPSLRARALARRALSVPHDLPLGEAVRRAQEQEAGGLVVLSTDGRPVGIVDERAVLATPSDRRPWMQAGSLARTLEPGLLLPADLAGEALVRAMQSTPANEYVLVEPDGSVYGVLVTSDVDKAFSTRPAQ